MRAFVTAVETGSLSAAARRLYISQSALSQTILSLERHLGVSLLTRSNTGIRPTEEGSVLLTEARAILLRHDLAIGRMLRRSDNQVSTIRIGMPAELPPRLLPSAVVRFRAKYPDCRLDFRHLSTSGQIAELQIGRLDLGFVRERPPQELDSGLIAEEKMGVLLPLDYATRFGSPEGIRLDRLIGLRWLGFARDDSPAWYDEVAATLRGYGIHDAASEGGSPGDELKLAIVSAGNSFSLAPPQRYYNLPASVSWLPLIGNSLVRRTWVTWPVHIARTNLPALVQYILSGQPDEMTHQDDGLVSAAQR